MLLGTWRSIQEQHGFAKGEYDFNFTENHVAISNPDKVVAKGTVQSFAPSAGLKQVRDHRVHHKSTAALALPPNSNKTETYYDHLPAADMDRVGGC